MVLVGLYTAGVPDEPTYAALTFPALAVKESTPPFADATTFCVPLAVVTAHVPACISHIVYLRVPLPVAVNAVVDEIFAPDFEKVTTLSLICAP